MHVWRALGSGSGQLQVNVRNQECNILMEQIKQPKCRLRGGKAWVSRVEGLKFLGWEVNVDRAKSIGFKLGSWELPGNCEFVQ